MSQLPTALALLAVAGQGIAYLLSIVLAGQLGVSGFEAYAVAAAAFVLMVTVAPRGYEKCALRRLPALLEHGDWGRARGFLRVGLRGTLWMSLLTGAGVGSWAWWGSGLPAATGLAVVVSCVALPAGALAHYALEVLTATGRELRATAIFRIGVPSTTLASFLVLLALPGEASGALATGCWGVAWILAAVVMGIEIRRVAAPALWRAEPIEEASTWTEEARPFWLYRIALALLGQAGVLALDALQPSPSAVGAYAAASATAALALVLATSTNRAYSRQLSILLERRAFATLLEVRRQRLRWLVPTLAVFLVVAFAFTRELVGLFRPEFVDEGVAPLRLLAVTTAFTALLSLAPTYLKYRRQNRATFTTVGCAAAGQLLLLVLLVPQMGATGAAIAYAVSMCGMYAAFALQGHRELRRLRVSG